MKWSVERKGIYTIHRVKKSSSVRYRRMKKRRKRKTRQTDTTSSSGPFYFPGISHGKSRADAHGANEITSETERERDLEREECAFLLFHPCHSPVYGPSRAK